jgi:hypothetical protein
VLEKEGRGRVGKDGVEIPLLRNWGVLLWLMDLWDSLDSSDGRVFSE